VGDEVPKQKLTILLDFDGPVHAYTKGWADGTIYDEPVMYAFDAIRALVRHYQVVIFSTRAGNVGGKDQILTWLELHGLEPEIVEQLWITNEKLPALFQIDDRAIRFESWVSTFDDILTYYGPPNGSTSLEFEPRG
jgi:hypothetical protein